MTDTDKKNMVKARLLVLSEMIYEKTDDEHPMDTFEITDYLADNGVPANTKTLRSDIALLRQRGMDTKWDYGALDGAFLRRTTLRQRKNGR